jgi:hypothetical protein
MELHCDVDQSSSFRAHLGKQYYWCAPVTAHGCLRVPVSELFLHSCHDMV